MAKAVTVVFAGDTSKLQRALGDAETHTNRWGSALKSLALGVGVVGVAAGALAIKIGKDSVQAFLDQEKVVAQTNAAIKSTGGVANVTAEEIGNLTDTMQRKLGVDADMVRGGVNLLLTFTNVRNEAGKGNDVFTQATKLMTDMSVAMGQDASQSAIQLGKALNDPIAGVGALSRVGIQFNADQKKMIETMVESGDLMGAQKIILKELETQFGGSAAAAGDTFAGKMDKLNLALGEAKEAIGQVLVEEVLPAFIEGLGLGKGGTDDLADAALRFGDWVKLNGPEIANTFRDIGGAVRGVVDGIQDLVGWIDKLPKDAGGERDFPGTSWWNDLKKGPLNWPFGEGHIFGPDRKATGGPINGPVLVGEQGPELFMPGASGSIIPRSGMTATGGGVTININAPVYGVDDLTETIRRALARTGQLNAGVGF